MSYEHKKDEQADKEFEKRLQGLIEEFINTGEDGFLHFSTGPRKKAECVEYVKKTEKILKRTLDKISSGKTKPYRPDHENPENDGYYDQNEEGGSAVFHDYYLVKIDQKKYPKVDKRAENFFVVVRKRVYCPEEEFLRNREGVRKRSLLEQISFSYKEHIFLSNKRRVDQKEDSNNGKK